VKTIIVKTQATTVWSVH